MVASPTVRLCVACGLALSALLFPALPLVAGEAGSEPNMLPVPSVTIYPGDAISGMLIVEREFPVNMAASRYGVVTERAAIIGKIARRTLLPGAPIPANAVMEPRIVANGARVRVVLDEGGMEISTYGAALQPGSVGDVISVRNLESGLTISGVVQADGSVRVDGS